MMLCPRCNTVLDDDDSVFCGNCGNQITPIYARGATVPELVSRIKPYDQRYGTAKGYSVAQHSPIPDSHLSQVSPFPPLQPSQSLGPPGKMNSEFPPSPFLSPAFPSRRARNTMSRNVFIATIFLLLVLLATVALVGLSRIHNAAVPSGVSGTAFFSDSLDGQGYSNTIEIEVNGLSAPPAGTYYRAWLMNEGDEQTFPLGTLVRKGGSFQLKFTGGGTNQLGRGSRLEITMEEGELKLPTGNIVLSGTFPALPFLHIGHLLVSFPTTPEHIGLLVGLRDQTRKLNTLAGLLQNASAQGNTLTVQCGAQSIINLIEGTHGVDVQPLHRICAHLNITDVGDGFGLLGPNDAGYIASAAAHASLAATQITSTKTIKIHARQVEVAMENIKGWIATVNQDALDLLQNPQDGVKAQQIATLSDHSLNGVDLNNDGSIDPVTGEAGAIAAYHCGQLMAQLPLTP